MWIGIAQRDGTFTGRKTIEAADQSTLGTHQNLAGHNVKARRIDTRHNTPRPRGTTRLTCWCILGEPGINDERNALAPLFTRRIATYGGKDAAARGGVSPTTAVTPNLQPSTEPSAGVRNAGPRLENVQPASRSSQYVQYR